MCLTFLITKNKLLKTQLPQFWLRDLAVLPIHSLTKSSQHPVDKRGRKKRKSIVLIFESQSHNQERLAYQTVSTNFPLSFE